MTPLEKAAKAMYEEYSDIEYDGRPVCPFEDLDYSSQVNWKAVASACIRAYDKALKEEE